LSTVASADRYGLPISSSAAARDAYVAGVDCILSANTGAEEHLGRALAAEPGFALAQIALARALFLSAKVPQAREHAARAREIAPKATPREQSHVNALAHAIEGNPPRALEATREHLARWPRDAMVLAPATGVFGLIGFSGRSGREPELYELLAGLAPHYGADWWFDMTLAFAACETGRLDQARSLIERSLAANPRNPHGAHIKAHVHYELGEHRAALDFLEDWLPAYPRQGLMHCHLSWHVALAALALGDRERAWRAYREGVHPAGGAWGPPLNVATDSPSFLWRAELAGEPRHARLWGEVRDYALQSFPTAGVWFADVHVALACAAAGDGASATPRASCRRAQSRPRWRRRSPPSKRATGTAPSSCSRPRCRRPFASAAAAPSATWPISPCARPARRPGARRPQGAPRAPSGRARLSRTLSRPRTEADPSRTVPPRRGRSGSIPSCSPRRQAETAPRCRARTAARSRWRRAGAAPRPCR
jgi:tetratricopeptide (TPR) repeat protein